MSSVQMDERPPSLLDKRPIETGTIVPRRDRGGGRSRGAFRCSWWPRSGSGLASGCAIASEDKVRPMVPDNVIAAEFVRLGKPFDPTKLPSRKVPPVAKRRPDGVVVSRIPRQQQEKPEEKKEKDGGEETSMLDNLVDRTKEFAEDVEYEQEGDPNGHARGHGHHGPRGRHLPRTARVVLPARLDRAQHACRIPTS